LFAYCNDVQQSFIKNKLLISYCFSLYGSVLWNFAMVMLKVCAVHGESVSDVYGVCHLMLIVSYYHYCAVVCLQSTLRENVNKPRYN